MSGTGKSSALAEPEKRVSTTCTQEVDASRPLDAVVEQLVAIGREKAHTGFEPVPPP
jgi:hypothetical protein